MRRPSPRPRRAPLLPGSRAQLPLFRAPPASPWPGLHPLPARHGWSSFFPATKLPWPPSSAFAPPCVARLACSPAPVHARILFLPGARPHLHLPASALPKPSHGVVPPWCRVSLCQSPMAPSRLAFLVSGFGADEVSEARTTLSRCPSDFRCQTSSSLFRVSLHLHRCSIGRQPRRGSSQTRSVGAKPSSPRHCRSLRYRLLMFHHLRHGTCYCP